MRLADRSIALLLSITLLSSTSISAQQPHVVDPAALDQALTQRTADVAAQREAVRTALQQSQVREVADRLGLDIARAEAAVATLDGEMLNQLAAQAQQVNEGLEGGQTVRLNLLWVIIGLLVIILIIVAS